MAVRGAVLCGGASRRMGRDKALVEIDGVALARRVADALRAGGCGTVVAVGGDAEALAEHGLAVVADRWPGEGPLGALATALATADPGDVVVVAPCDLLAPSGDIVGRLVVALDADGRCDVAAPLVEAAHEWILAAWRVHEDVVADVEELLASGARRLDAVAAVVERRDVVLPPWALADADTPDDLPATGPAAP